MGQECAGEDSLLGQGKTTAQCAEICETTPGCEYFLSGTGSKKGNCYWEKSECESFVDNEYNVFRLTQVLISVAKGSQCTGTNELMGTGLNVQQCGALCQQQMGCEFFMLGVGSRLGECHWERNDCSNLEADEFDVYKYRVLEIPPKEYQVLQRGKECEGADELLVENANFEGCLAACREIAECKYFLLGTGTKEGKCWMENNDCTKLIDNDYDLYERFAPPTAAPTASPLPSAAELEQEVAAEQLELDQASQQLQTAQLAKDQLIDTQQTEKDTEALEDKGTNAEKRAAALNEADAAIETAQATYDEKSEKVQKLETNLQTQQQAEDAQPASEVVETPAAEAAEETPAEAAEETTAAEPAAVETAAEEA